MGKTINYKGKLYGRFGGKYFDTDKTAQDYDNLEEDQKVIEELLKIVEFIKQNHPEIEIPNKLDYAIITRNEAQRIQGKNDSLYLSAIEELKNNFDSYRKAIERGDNLYANLIFEDDLTQTKEELFTKLSILRGQNKELKKENEALNHVNKDHENYIKKLQGKVKEARSHEREIIEISGLRSRVIDMENFEKVFGKEDSF